MKNPHPHRDEKRHSTDAQNHSRSDSVTDKRPYRPPRVTSHGPLIRIALGGTPGTGDSGLPAVQQPGP
jgi:hypothetical protein